MNLKPVGELSIELRYLDAKLAKKKDGGGREWKIMKEKLTTPRQAWNWKNWWNTFFIISCLYAVFNDPIFCYINAIDYEHMCMTTDEKLAYLNIFGRVATDAVYLIDILIYKCRSCCTVLCCCCGCCGCCGCCCKSNKSCNTRIKTSVSILSRFFVSLPIAEIAVIQIFLVKNSSDASLLWLILTPVQYILRIYYMYDSLKWRPVIDISRIQEWIRPLLDFVPFILTSHLVGAFWYLFATRKQIACWVLKRGVIYPFPYNNSPVTSDAHFASCEAPSAWYKPLTPGRDTSAWYKSCPFDEPDPSKYDFGIYSNALQSRVTSSAQPLLKRILQSFWWGLRNLSSFGSNLNSSMDPLEILFCVLISTGGMALFLVYLNATVKESQERSRNALLEEKKKWMVPDIDLWLSKQNLPKNRDTVTKENQDMMKKVIKDNIHKLEEINDINLDLKNILSVLPIKDKKNLMCSLFLASLTKVPLLQNINEKVLKAICEHLMPVTYTEDNCIVQEGKPLRKFLLITQGVAVTYSNGGASRGSSSNNSMWLNKGDFYGEELLEWAFNPSFPDLPISARNVIAEEKVEAFAIRASDLKNVYTRFWWLFTKEIDDASQLEQLEHLAASSIQAIWCQRRARKHSTTSHVQSTFWRRRLPKTMGWDRFKVN